MKSTFFIVFFIYAFLPGCANQQPPSGGVEDKAPPEAFLLKPSKKTMFMGNKVIIQFDEYVDRRSLQDAFRISPLIKDIEFDWSGKTVEIVFPFSLEKVYPNRTFVINIGSSLKDLRGNSLTNPYIFAFSTGPDLDKGTINGKVYNHKNKKISVLAYRLDNYDPLEKYPDYFTEISQDGSYSFQNMSSGKYRLIALEDDDKNFFYTQGRENYGVLPYDITILDSNVISNVDFIIKNISPEEEEKFFFPDSLSIVYSSVENGSLNVIPYESIYFLFKKHIPSREEFTSNFRFKDELSEINLRPVFIWKNDSTVEVFTSEKLGYGKRYSITFSFRIKEDSVYNFRMNFMTAGQNLFGEIKGKIQSDYLAQNVVIEMKNSEKKPERKLKFISDQNNFSFSEIFEGSYNIFAFIDENNNMEYDYGSPYPFQASEPFFIYPQDVKIRGGWSVENILIKFIKPADQ
ncbi:MAG: Ig-like domain-containing protein [Ignavibacteria bacterium]|nr:Ig-like domain-containing protein [Ignavibacteria bacterium]